MNENERVCLQYAADREMRCEHLAMDRCADAMVYELEDVELESRGRIIELTLMLRDVCPGKRTALGVMLHERDADGGEYPRGMRTMTIPAHGAPCNQDILVRQIRFVLPEELSLAGEDCQRRFVVRTLAHYIDVDEGALCACRIR